MTSFVRSARQIINIDDNKTEVEIKYDKYLEGFGYETFVDHFNTNLIGSTNIYTVHKSGKSLRYEQFLNTMVNNTTETLRRCVSIQLENVLFENRNIFSHFLSKSFKLRKPRQNSIMNTILYRILCPTTS